MDAYETWEAGGGIPHAGALETEILRMIERMLPRQLHASAETGCGKSTILLSNLSRHHTVFCLDGQTPDGNASFDFFQGCPLTRAENLELVLGPTQATLPRYRHTRRYELVLLDGPHGWPFPELEYYFFYPHIESGGLLVVDDCHIPTIGRLADVLAEDPMWELEGFVSKTGVFRRTDAPLFDPFGDGWWEQTYNRRRISPQRRFYLGDRPPRDRVSDLHLDLTMDLESDEASRPD